MGDGPSRPEMVMCLSCGEFSRAIEEDGDLLPLRDECRDCSGTRFKDNATGTIIDISND